MQVLLANPRGFCAGVDRAIDIVEQASGSSARRSTCATRWCTTVFVVDDLRAKGAVFVDELAAVPDGATVIFSAHGVARGARRGEEPRPARVRRHLPAGDQGAHGSRASPQNGTECVLIGHAGHPEVEGTMGQASDGIYLVERVEDVAGPPVRDPDNLAYVTQTTLSMDDTARIVEALRARFPAIVARRRTTSATPPRTARMR